MLGQSQVQTSGQGSDDAVGTHQELARSLSGVRRELAEEIRGLPGVRRKLAEGISSLLGVRRELVESNHELGRMASGVHQKKTKRLVKRSSVLSKSLPGVRRVLLDLMVT
ncbi:hypothetical protein GW17_00042633 [Ensete ventricosum]|nr:hypothetical protein GW17_00042633 [Ensete ventricosum]